MVDESLLLLKNTATPKSTYSIFPISVVSELTVMLGEIEIQSRNLAKNLKNCTRAVLFAATLGAEVDRMINRFSVANIAKAAILQAAASAYIEEYCDAKNDEIEQQLYAEPAHLRPRFSPGYGDFNILYQPQILSILKAQTTIGLGCTESYMLTPTKSVTAVIGISTEQETCNKKGCEVCTRIDCPYRR